MSEIWLPLGLADAPKPVEGFYVGRQRNGTAVPVPDKSHGFLHRGLRALGELKSLLGQVTSVAH